MTIGQIMLYGGLGLVGVSILGLILSICIFSIRKKKVMEKLTNLY